MKTHNSGIDYFSHDTDLSSDPKVQFLETEHGLNGYAIYMKLLEWIYRGGYYVEWKEKHNKLLAKKTGLNIDEIKEIIDTCLEEELFSKAMYEQYQILTSASVQKRFIMARQRVKILYFISEYLLVDPEDHAWNSQDICISSLNDSADTQGSGEGVNDTLQCGNDNDTGFTPVSNEDGTATTSCSNDDDMETTSCSRDGEKETASDNHNDAADKEQNGKGNKNPPEKSKEINEINKGRHDDVNATSQRRHDDVTDTSRCRKGNVKSPEINKEINKRNKEINKPEKPNRFGKIRKLDFEDFTILDDQVKWAESRGISREEYIALSERCLNHHSAKGNKFADFNRVVQNWILKDLDYRKEGRKPAHPNNKEPTNGELSREQKLENIKTHGRAHPELPSNHYLNVSPWG